MTDLRCQTCKSRNFNNSEYEGVFWESLLYSIHFNLITSFIFSSIVMVKKVSIQVVMIRQLDCPNVLLANIIHLLQLTAVVALHDGSLKDASDMLMVGNSRVIVTILKTLDGFSINLCHMCQPLNHVHGRSAFKCIQQVS